MSNRHPQSTTPNSAINQRGSALASAVGLLLLLALSIAWLAHAEQPEPKVTAAKKATDGPIIPPAKGDQCVADTALMRTDHMDLLNHQRDDTVIDGIRNQPFSLVGCVDCHAQTTADGTPIRIDAEGQFCQSCHQYAAVKIDCFSCHAAIPDQASEQAANQGAGNSAYQTTADAAARHAVPPEPLLAGRPHSLLPVSLNQQGTTISSLSFAKYFGNDDDHAAGN